MSNSQDYTFIEIEIEQIIAKTTQKPNLLKRFDATYLISKQFHVYLKSNYFRLGKHSCHV